MATWTSETTSRIAEAVRSGADRLRDALRAAFGVSYDVHVGDHEAVDRWDIDADLAGAGLLLTLRRNDDAVLAVIPESAMTSEAEDPTAEKSAALADALHQLFPEDLGLTTATARHVTDLAGELRDQITGSPLTLLPLTLSTNGSSGTLRLVWPVPVSTGEAESDTDEAADASGPSAAGDAGPRAEAPAAASAATYHSLDDAVQLLPPYARSLLRISLPVKVTLAETRLPLKEVLGLGPGSIIQFKKSCEDTLALEAGEQQIAEGEAVKVGDKFGLWITSIVLPAERFFSQGTEGPPRRIH